MILLQEIEMRKQLLMLNHIIHNAIRMINNEKKK